MNDEDLKKMCDIYKEYILADPDTYLMLLAKDIERQVRHKCASQAYSLAHTLSNLNN